MGMSADDVEELTRRRVAECLGGEYAAERAGGSDSTVPDVIVGRRGGRAIAGVESKKPPARATQFVCTGSEPPLHRSALNKLPQTKAGEELLDAINKSAASGKLQFKEGAEDVPIDGVPKELVAKYIAETYRAKGNLAIAAYVRGRLVCVSLATGNGRTEEDVARDIQDVFDCQATCKMKRSGSQAIASETAAAKFKEALEAEGYTCDDISVEKKENGKNGCIARNIKRVVTRHVIPEEHKISGQHRRIMRGAKATLHPETEVVEEHGRLTFGAYTINLKTGECRARGSTIAPTISAKVTENKLTSDERLDEIDRTFRERIASDVAAAETYLNESTKGTWDDSSPDDDGAVEADTRRGREITRYADIGNISDAAAGKDADVQDAVGGNPSNGDMRRAPNGDVYVYVQGYLKTNGTKVKSYWRLNGNMA